MDISVVSRRVGGPSPSYRAVLSERFISWDVNSEVWRKG